MTNSEKLTDGEIALLSLNKTLIEVLIAAEIIPAEFLSQMLEKQAVIYLQAGNTKASGMFEHVRLFVADPKRASHREDVRRLLKAPPQGSA